MAHVFISYSRVDIAFVETLYQRLQRMRPNWRFWYDQAPHGLLGGDPWWDEILNAIADADIFIYVLSNESIQSKYCQAEFEEARRLQKRIITIQARDRTKLTGELRDIHYVDMKNGVDDPEALVSLSGSLERQAALVKRHRPLWQPPTPKPADEAAVGRPVGAPDVDTPTLEIPAMAMHPADQAEGFPRAYWAISAVIALIVIAAVIAELSGVFGGSDEDNWPGSVTHWDAFHTPNSTIELEQASPSGVKIKFNVGEQGWVGMSRLVRTDWLSNTTGIQLRYRGWGAPNTFEFKLLYPVGDTGGSTTFGRTWLNGTPTSGWIVLEIPYEDFECWTIDLCEGQQVDPDAVWKIDVAVSHKPGNTPGEGELIVDAIQALTGTVGTATPTDTPTLAYTATNTPDPVLAALVRAATFSGGNTDWEPFVWDFNGVEMVLVPAECFIMGNGSDEHEICFDEPFWIDRYEVTNGQFAAFGGQAASASYFSDDDRPREMITWLEATAFCESRGARLPTEAEWEYAARGPEAWDYPWGNEFDRNNVIGFRYRPRIIPTDFPLDGTESVGSLPEGASWVGALDMSGNVWEWTSTIYRDYPYQADDGREDNSDTNSYRVMRGGCWDSYEGSAPFRAFNRLRSPPDYGGFVRGFRCARSRGS